MEAVEAAQREQLAVVALAVTMASLSFMCLNKGMKPIHYVVIFTAAILGFGPPVLQALGTHLPSQWAGIAPAILAVVSAIYIAAKKEEGS